MKSKQYRDLAGGLASVMVAMLFIYYTLPIEPKAAMFPFYISVLLLVFGVSLIIRNIIILRKQKAVITGSMPDSGESERDPRVFHKMNYMPLVVSLFCLAFLKLLPWTGFEVSAVMLIFLIMLSINRKEAITKVYFALIVPVVLVIIFRYALNIRLPMTFEMLFE